MSGASPERRTPPAVRSPAAVTMPPIERAALASGVPVILARRPRIPLLDVHVVIRAGAALDRPAHAGRTALAAALLEEGTTQRESTALAEALEHVGAELDIRTGWDATTLALHCLAPHADVALDVIGDVAAHATLPEDAFARKRAERIADWLGDRVEPGVLATERLHRAIYGDAHPYATPLHGTEPSLAALRHRDVTSVHAQRMRADNAFVVVVGDIDMETLLPRLENAFGGWTGGAEPAAAVAAAPQRSAAIHIVPRAGAPQSEVRAGFAGPRRADADFFALSVLNTILGGAFTSRLNRTLREEKGYTYGARSAFALRGGPGPFTVAVAVATAATADTVHEIHSHITRIREEPVSATELERARSYLARGFPRLLESGDRLAAQLAQVELFGLGSDFLPRYVERVLDVDAGMVLTAAQRHLDAAALQVAIAGDAAHIEADLADLAIAPLLVGDDPEPHFRP